MEMWSFWEQWETIIVAVIKESPTIYACNRASLKNQAPSVVTELLTNAYILMSNNVSSNDTFLIMQRYSSVH